MLIQGKNEKIGHAGRRASESDSVGGGHACQLFRILVVLHFAQRLAQRLLTCPAALLGGRVVGFTFTTLGSIL